MEETTHEWICRGCGQTHRTVTLRRGERARCVRCGRNLARRSWFGPNAALAFALSAVALGIPALLLPFVTVSKFDNERISYVTTGAQALGAHNLNVLGAWVAVCAVLAPALLLGFLIYGSVAAPLERSSTISAFAHRAVHAVQEWSMPEVHVLSVLVAFFKLGSLVDVEVGPGMYCYAASAVFTLMAWRSFTLDPEAAAHPDDVETLEGRA